MMMSFSCSAAVAPSYRKPSWGLALPVAPLRDHIRYPKGRSPESLNPQLFFL